MKPSSSGSSKGRASRLATATGPNPDERDERLGGSTPSPSAKFTIGRKAFAKITAVEKAFAARLWRRVKGLRLH